MQILTPTPETTVYGKVVLTVLALGSFNLARHVHLRWSKKVLSFLGTGALVKGSIAAGGMLIIPVTELFPLHWMTEFQGAVTGLIAGWLVIQLEQRMTRNCNRANLAARKLANTKRTDGFMRDASIVQKLSLATSGGLATMGAKNIRSSFGKFTAEPDFKHYSTVATVSIAIAEELLFRGEMTSIARHLPGCATWLMLGTTTFLFAFSHVHDNFSACLRKLPLSVLTLAGTLLSGTVLSAICTHIMLNLYARPVMYRLNTPTTGTSGPLTPARGNIFQ